MGWRFGIEYANIVAYLTVPNQRTPPRISAFQLREFLGSLQGQYRERPPLISADSFWVDQIRQTAAESSRWVDSLNLKTSSFVDPHDTANVLAPLRDVLGRYNLYGLPVGAWNDRERLNAFAQHAAYSSEHHGLFLIPDNPGTNETLEIFDPSPIARKITARPDLWPGILFWVPTGESAFASLEQAEVLYQDLIHVMRTARYPSTGAAKVLEDFNNAREDKSGVKRLLHLSDLHFGTSHALQNQAYLMSHLKTKINDFQRVIITGDLFDNPKRKHALAFRNFRSDLEASTGKELIIVPGNHDQKIQGNTFFGLGRRLDELAKTRVVKP